MAAVMPAHTRADTATAPDARAFRQAMRCLAGGVCVITASDGHEGGDGLGRTGLTATSVMSLSVDPAELVVSVNQNSSTWPVLLAARRFGVNVLAADQVDVAQRFAGIDGLRGPQRYAGARWERTGEGVWLLTDALTAFACTVAQMWVHHSHALVVGRVDAITTARSTSGEATDRPLLYWHGAYGALTSASVDG